MNQFISSSDANNTVTKSYGLYLDGTAFANPNDSSSNNANTDVTWFEYTKWFDLRNWTEIKILSNMTGSGTLRDFDIETSDSPWGTVPSTSTEFYNAPDVLNRNGTDQGEIIYKSPLPSYIRFHNYTSEGAFGVDPKQIKIFIIGRIKINKEEETIIDVPAFNPSVDGNIFNT